MSSQVASRRSLKSKDAGRNDLLLQLIRQRDVSGAC